MGNLYNLQGTSLRKVYSFIQAAVNEGPKAPGKVRIRLREQISLTRCFKLSKSFQFDYRFYLRIADTSVMRFRVTIFKRMGKMEF